MYTSYASSRIHLVESNDPFSAMPAQRTSNPSSVVPGRLRVRLHTLHRGQSHGLHRRSNQIPGNVFDNTLSHCVLGQSFNFKKGCLTPRLSIPA
jgi:hypothetical protein